MKFSFGLCGDLCGELVGQTTRGFVLSNEIAKLAAGVENGSVITGAKLASNFGIAGARELTGHVHRQAARFGLGMFLESVPYEHRIIAQNRE